MNNLCFIDDGKIKHLIDSKKVSSSDDIRRILKKALELKGLDVEDVASLINIEDEEILNEVFQTAKKIKNLIYGNRLVVFAPLYLSNYCSNNCTYCGFRTDNKEMKRKSLTLDELDEEVKLILEQGHKRILMLMGEHSKECSLDYFLDMIDRVYSIKDSKGNSIRRINVEIAPLTVDEFAKLKEKKIGTYTVFQETYHKETYQSVHPTGKKADYDWRLNVMDRALENGMNDVGIGALFGLYDYKYEVISLIEHAKHLDEKFGVGPHTISVPRIEPAQNAPSAMDIPSPVSDLDFKKIVAVLRCAVPYTGIILSTRESPEMRQQVFDLGVSQISAGSKTNPGGYNEAEINPEDEEQFSLSDTRSTDEVISSVIKQGYVPSFCTGCYRLGRVGKDFMDLAKPGLIKLHCLPNALTTLQEYLEDYADSETKEEGEDMIKKSLAEIPDEKRKEIARKFLERIKNGERDLYF